jgi:hypothetical protein
VGKFELVELFEGVGIGAGLDLEIGEIIGIAELVETPMSVVT